MYHTPAKYFSLIFFGKIGCTANNNAKKIQVVVIYHSPDEVAKGMTMLKGWKRL
jgi:hypothetical protein